MAVVLRRGDMKVGRNEDMEEFREEAAEDFRWDMVERQRIDRRWVYPLVLLRLSWLFQAISIVQI